MMTRADIERAKHTNAYCEIEKVLSTRKNMYLTKEEIYAEIGKLLPGCKPYIRSNNNYYRKNEEYTVGEILRCMEGSLAPVSCVRNGHIDCDHAAGCLTAPMWVELDEITNRYLDTISLRDLLTGEKWKDMNIQCENTKKEGQK